MKIIEVEEYEKQGVFFTHFNIYERTGITFERFCKLVETGAWQECYANEFAS